MRYIPQQHATKLPDGGYIIHGSNDIEMDYLRYATAYGRLEPVFKYLSADGLTKYEPVKYDNWYGLHFPLLQWDGPPAQMPEEFDGFSEDVQHSVVLAERHLLVDRLFENYIYSTYYLLPNDWAEVLEAEKQSYLFRFKSLTNFDKL